MNIRKKSGAVIAAIILTLCMTACSSSDGNIVQTGVNVENKASDAVDDVNERTSEAENMADELLGE